MKEHRNKQNTKLKERGMTLIALVVTIIVLLILAGVSIQMLTGETGILAKAIQAREETKKAEIKEQRKLAALEAATNTKTYVYPDENGEEVLIPAGFAPTGIDGESTVKEGFVIIDAYENEFVWIPCEYDEASAISSGANTDNVVYYNNANDELDTREENWKSREWYYNGGEWYDNQPHTIGKTSLEKEGIPHGFYVGRYEAGVPTNANFYVGENSKDKSYVNNDGAGFGNKYYLDTTDSARGSVHDTESIKNLQPISKQGAQAWNYITQGNAITVSENMYKTSTSVGSYLIDSHAWNTICKVMAKRGALGLEKDPNKNKKLTDSLDWGNFCETNTSKYKKIEGLFAVHNDSGGWTFATKYEYGKIPESVKNDSTNRLELATGISEDFKAYNIYDFAGNMFEWTTEVGKNIGWSAPPEYLGFADATGDECHEDICPTDKKVDAVIKGSSYNYNGSGYSVVDTYGNYQLNQAYSYLGFRVVLYIK